MFKIIAIVAAVCALFVSNGETAPTALQVLPEREGYVPVYIRNGNTPLVEINPGLAEAFHEINNIQAREAKTDEKKEDQTISESSHEDEAPKNKRQVLEDSASDASKSSSQEETSSEKTKSDENDKSDDATRANLQSESNVTPPKSADDKKNNEQVHAEKVADKSK